MSGWAPVAMPSDDKSIRTFLVHAVAVDPSGHYSLAFVPNGSDCIFIDTSVALTALKSLVGAGSASNDGYPNKLIVAYFLLHELGHIVQETVKQTPVDQMTVALCRELALAQLASDTSSPGNDACTTGKASEIAADRFAAEQVKRAFFGENAERRSQAAEVQKALYVMAIQIIVERAKSNRSRNADPNVFCDAGYSHPNFELKLLFAFDILNADRSWSFRHTLEQRAKFCGIKTYLLREPDPLGN